MLRVTRGWHASRKRAPASRLSWRTIAVAAGVAVTIVLIFEYGFWSLIGLIAIYGALDVAQRIEMRRDARNRLMIRSAVGHEARSIAYFGPARCCNQAAWVAKRLGWIVSPVVRESFWRRSVRFRIVPGAAPLSRLLEELNEARLATRIDLRGFAPSFARRLSEQGYWEAGRDI